MLEDVSPPSSLSIFETMRGSESDEATVSEEVDDEGDVDDMPPLDDAPFNAEYAASSPSGKFRRCGFTVDVAHRHGRMARYASETPVPEGEHVVVKIRGGKGIGVVSCCHEGIGNGRYWGQVAQVAAAGELKRYHRQIREEKKCVDFVNREAKQRDVPIVVHTAEFQFDRKKLTLNYASNVAKPDFRSLLKPLFSQFRCRIWFDATASPKCPVTRHEAACSV